MSDAVATRRNPLSVLIVTAAAAAVLGGTAVLWLHYGTAVFFEMIRSGLVACFG